jgi:lysophospholipase L1-like esterase
MTVWFFSVAEITLWLVGFEYRPGTVVIEKDGKTVAEALERSEEIGWQLKPNQGSSNEAGFIGDQIPVERKPGVLRIAGLGDSCTQFGEPPYIEIARNRLAEKRGTPVESLNAGISGFSSHQGLIRLRRDVMKYKPDVVVVYFGWNDHWVASQSTDAGQQVVRTSPLTKLLWKIDGSKLVQAGLFLVDSIRPPPVPTFRVPLDDYVKNLRAIIHEIRSIPAVPILVTAPTNATRATSWGEFIHLPRSLAEAYSSPYVIHQSYVAATKLIAEEERVPFVDAFADFGPAEGLIMSDHIHPTQAGYERIGKLIEETIIRENVEPAR